MQAIAASAPRRYTQLPRYFRWFSDRCVLRQIDDSDVARVWSAVAHPAFERCWTVGIPRSEDDVAAFVRTAQLDWQRGTRYAMAVLRKQTHDFVGWVELRTTSQVGAWTLDWFIHPRFIADPVAGEALSAAAELMFSTLDVRKLYARCLPGLAHFERLLNDVGFIEVAAAGSIDAKSGRQRTHAVHELGRADWMAMRRHEQATRRTHDEQSARAPTWATVGLRTELQLV
jgi:RimJ/RimL family protein N-acetyltransferase